MTKNNRGVVQLWSYAVRFSWLEKNRVQQLSRAMATTFTVAINGCHLHCGHHHLTMLQQ